SDRFSVILPHPGATEIEHPEVVVGPSVPLLGGPVEPLQSSGVVLGSCPAVRIDDPKVHLGWRVAMLGGSLEPLDRALGVEPGADRQDRSHPELVLFINV